MPPATIVRLIQALMVINRGDTMTHAQESCTRNMCKSLEHVSCFLAHVFFLYKFLAPNRIQLYLVQDTSVHVIKIVRFDWSAVFLAVIVYRIYCQPHFLCTLLIQDTCMNLHQILTQETCASFWLKFLVQILDYIIMCRHHHHHHDT